MGDILYVSKDLEFDVDPKNANLSYRLTLLSKDQRFNYMLNRYRIRRNYLS
jgi:hypothetical protein